MDDNGFENDDIDFSIIAPDSDKPKAVDFSVDSLLVDPQPMDQKQESPKKNQEQIQTEMLQPDGSFMRDLGKMEKSISYESNPYNIYQSSELPMEFTGFNQAKQESTCTKTLNNMTKGGSRFIEPDFKHLILDFKEENEQPDFKIKQNFQDYFGTQTLLSKKLQQQKIKQKIYSKSKKKYYLKSPSHLQESGRTKQSTLTSVHSVKSYQKVSNQKPLFKPRKAFLNSPPTQRTTKHSRNDSKSNNSKSQTKKVIKQTKANKSGEREKTLSIKNVSRKKNLQKKKKVECQQVYSEYYGFAATTSPTSRTCKLVGNQSKSKGKKIVFSKRNVHN